MKAIQSKVNNSYILYDADLLENPDLISFDSAVWAQRSSIIGFAEGRGTTFFVDYAGLCLVLRHYIRGGMISRWLHEEYVWLGLRQTRAWQEWHLLAKMREMGLPVPVPVAAQVKKDGLFYTADIMIQRINDTHTLAHELERHALAEGHWQALGGLIRRFHEQGVYHADLNANNILLDTGGRFYLIDFDRGRLRRQARRWQLGNLARLQRSLEKLRSKARSFYFSEDDWKYLLQGYGE